MLDVQNLEDKRNLEINKVGVKNVQFPLVIADKSEERQHIVANVDMYVDLPRRFKGVHMSRFIEILNEYRDQPMSMYIIKDVLERMKQNLNAETAHVEIGFPYFIEKESPVSRQKSLMNYDCKFIGIKNQSKKDFVLEVAVPISTVCPCSKEISERGAHSQRGKVTVKIRGDDFIWIEEVVDVVEKQASCGVYSLLKREDEKHVTETAYDNPKFVEDVVRDIALKLKADKRISWFSVECDNQESIHNHSAYACIKQER